MGADWMKIEQALADAAKRQGFDVQKVGGRFVLEWPYDDATLDLEHLAREVADRIKP